MTKVNITLLFISLSISMFAQYGNRSAVRKIHELYAWEENPAVHTVADEFKNYPGVFILHNRFQETAVENGVMTYFTEHRIIHVNSDAGIEQFNKVYIPMYSGRELMSLKVRAISPDGKITELNQANLKELSNLEGYGGFKIFAIEGLQVGGELEFMYTTKFRPTLFSREVFQKEVPVVESNFQIIFPTTYSFIAKSYNGLPNPEKINSDATTKSLVIRAKNVPALEQEEFSATKASQMYVDVKLDAAPNANIQITWSRISEQLVEHSFDGNVLNQVWKLLKPLKLESMTTKDQVKTVEQFIKTNFTYKNTREEAFEDPKQVLKQRVGNETGLVKIYMACWGVMKIPAVIVFAANRYTATIDPAFPTPMDLNEVLFYFPGIDQYVTPSVPYMRLGYPPESLAGTKALYISYAVANYKALYERYDFRKLPTLPVDHNKLGVTATVNLKDLAAPEVISENFYQGYRAFVYRGIYYYQPEESRKQFLKDNTLSAIEDGVVIDQKVTGDEMDLSLDPDAMFTIKTHYTAPSLMEKAGEDYLLSIGKIIGKQSELYQEKTRRTDIEFHSINDYHHEISIDIPDGYHCSGMDELKINHAVLVEGEEVMKFVSDYTLNGNKLVVRVNEFYKVLHLPKSKYEEFRAVVNSAADFNKAVLVLRPVAGN